MVGSPRAGFLTVLDTGVAMHFFYLDETGDTGKDLQTPDQPIFVLGGITVSEDMAQDHRRGAAGYG
jgi:hypothetical protein